MKLASNVESTDKHSNDIKNVMNTLFIKLMFTMDESSKIQGNDKVSGVTLSLFETDQRLVNMVNVNSENLRNLGVEIDEIDKVGDSLFGSCKKKYGK